MTTPDRSSGTTNAGRDRKRPFLSTPAGFVLSVFLAIGAVFLWLEHRAHILAVLPLLLPLVACLGMHFFMHRGHGRGDRN